MKICKKLKLQTAFNYQFDYVLISDVISSEKYSSGTFKNLYSEQKSLFLRICFDDDKVLKTPNVEENTENMENTENTRNTQFIEVSQSENT